MTRFPNRPRSEAAGRFHDRLPNETGALAIEALAGRRRTRRDHLTRSGDAGPAVSDASGCERRERNANQAVRASRARAGNGWAGSG
jgi:hypothetical protein